MALLILALGAFGPLLGAADPPPAEVAPAAGKSEPAAATDQVWESSHSVVVGGRRLDYRATAGWLPVSLDEGKNRARMFFVAYRLEAVDAAARPLTFRKRRTARTVGRASDGVGPSQHIDWIAKK